MKRPINTYTPEEVASILNLRNRRSTGSIRNCAIVAMLYGSGLRVSELCDLMPSDVSDDGTIDVRNGKGNKQRFSAIDRHHLQYVTDWIAVRSTLPVSETTPLFCSFRKGICNRMCRRDIWFFLKGYAVRAKITKRVHPHGFRHSMATKWAMSGIPLPVLQGQLGHSNLSTTDRYVARVTPQHLIDAANAVTPLVGTVTPHPPS